MKAPEILYTSSAPVEIDPEIMKLAQDLSSIHGLVRITEEASGIHLYMASPACLEEFGTDELSKMHLAVNVSKYLTLGQLRCARCMKTETAYDILDLLSYPPLSERGYEHKPQVIVQKAANDAHLEDDGHGNRVPKSPGEVIPIMDLPEDHPACLYLSSRGYERADLAQQFDLAFCVKERPDVFYSRMAGGFRKTPQGRIIFYIRQKGVTLGWQARILEMKQDGYIWYWHPYKNEWTAVLQEDPDGGKPIVLPKFATAGKWDPAKYLFPTGTVKNACLMGYDATMEAYGASDGAGTRWCGLVEGPMDAGRFGVPFMAIMGKSLSEPQANLIKEAKFAQVVYVRDKDAAGEKGAASVGRQLKKMSIDVKVLTPPEGYKDLGEMTTEAAREFVLNNI